MGDQNTDEKAYSAREFAVKDVSIVTTALPRKLLRIRISDVGPSGRSFAFLVSTTDDDECDWEEDAQVPKLKDLITFLQCSVADVYLEGPEGL